MIKILRAKLTLIALSFILIPVSSANELANYINDKYPLFYDTYAKTEKDYLSYLLFADEEIKAYKERADLYYIKGNLLLGYVGFLIRKAEEGAGTRSDYFTSNDAVERVSEYQKYYRKSLDLHNRNTIISKLNKTALENIYSQSRNPELRELAKLSIIEMTDINSLKGCPNNIPETDPNYECSPIANSWSEYLFNEYSTLFAVYGELLDSENMQRIEREFIARIKGNEKEDRQTDKLHEMFINKFSHRRDEFWRQYEAGELEGKTFDINQIPEAYKGIPLYWKNYLLDKGIADYAQWDIRGSQPPSGKIQTEKLASKKRKVLDESVSRLTAETVLDTESEVLRFESPVNKILLFIIITISVFGLYFYSRRKIKK